MSSTKEFFEPLYQFTRFFSSGDDSKEHEAKIIQYLLALDEPFPDLSAPGTGVKLIDLVKGFLLPKLPINDSLFEVEFFVRIISRLPKTSEYDKALDILIRLLVTELWTDIKKPPTMIAGDSYRTADGSNYSINYSALGVSNSRYAINSPIQTLPINLPVLPKAETIFDKVLVNKGDFVEHPGGISSTLFYLGIIITHDLFRSSPSDPNINLNSSYLDLSPLYGSNLDQQKTIRSFKKGLLKPDTFQDSRFLLQPPGVIALTLLFSRNHNYIAKKLLEINEHGRFSVKNPNDPNQVKKQDEDLFQTARLINIGFYVKIILTNYLRAIFGLDKGGSFYIDPTIPYRPRGALPAVPTGIGNVVSLEFNYIYRWHPATSKDDIKWTEKEFKKVLGRDDWEDISLDEFKKKLEEWGSKIPKDPSKWGFANYKRDSNNFFKDVDIARELVYGTKKVAGAFGANRIHPVFRPIEILGIESARTSKLSSLNDFRRSLNLVPYKTFEEMNPNPMVVNELKGLYGHIENVELFPGLMSEKTKPHEVDSISLPFTASRSILSDAVNLVRNDRFLTDEFNPRNLTSWGWKELQPDLNGLASGGMIGKMILTHLPSFYKPNSAWALYPFTIPSQTKKNLQARGDDFWKNIDFDEPKIPYS